MPVHQRKGSPFWWYDFTLNGVRHRGSTKKEGKREAVAAEREERARLTAQTKHVESWRIREVLGTYWEEKLQHGNTAGGQEQMLFNISDLLGPDTPLEKIDTLSIVAFIAKRRGKLIGKANPTPIQRNTVNRDLATIKAAFNHAHKVHGKMLPNISWKELAVPEPPHRIRFLSRDEFDALIAAAHPDIRPIIRFAVATGLRKTNVLDLDWSEISLGNGLVSVKVKGGKAHSVKLTRPLRADLARTPPKDRKGKVFETLNFRKRWQAAVKDAGLVNVRFHDLRHTSASWARQAGADLADIRDHLGHSNMNVTMRYAHVKPEEHVTAADRISEVLWAQSMTQKTEKAS